MQRTVVPSDDRSDDPKPDSPRRIELLSGAPGRRRWPNELKARIVIAKIPAWLAKERCISDAIDLKRQLNGIDDHIFLK